jgi:hypothetical protein
MPGLDELTTRPADRAAVGPRPDTEKKIEKKVQRRRRRRIQLDLLPDIYDQVVQLQVANGLDSVRSVFRQAFRLYLWYTTRRSQGWTIQLVHRDGRVAMVDLGLEGERPSEGGLS